MIRTCSKRAAPVTRKLSMDGDGFSVSTLMIPAGKDIIKLPVSDTVHLKTEKHQDNLGRQKENVFGGTQSPLSFVKILTSKIYIFFSWSKSTT